MCGYLLMWELYSYRAKQTKQAKQAKQAKDAKTKHLIFPNFLLLQIYQVS